MSSTAATRKAIVNPMLLSHGTLICKDMAKSRRAIDDFFNRGDILDMSVVETDTSESHA